MRRFDLMHVMIDEPDPEADRAIANHIVAVHQLKLQALAAPYTMEDMQQYIKYARAIRPEMCDEVRPLAILCRCTFYTFAPSGGWLIRVLCTTFFVYVVDSVAPQLGTMVLILNESRSLHVYQLACCLPGNFEADHLVVMPVHPTVSL